MVFTNHLALIKNRKQIFQIRPPPLFQIRYLHHNRVMREGIDKFLPPALDAPVSIP
jgi:hypothetical protein